MRAWDSVTQGGSLRAGPAAFAILMAGLLLSLAPVSQPIEAAYYDLLQRLEGGTGSDAVVLVDTGALGNGSVWESPQFPGLLGALGRSGARMVIAVEPPPLSTSLPDSAQLATLAELERRSTQGDGSPAANDVDPKVAAFRSQLAEMRNRSDLQARIVQSASGLRNLVVAVPTFDGARGVTEARSACTKHLLEAGSGRDAAAGVAVRRVRAVSPPGDGLCRAALGAGHAEFWADTDGVVRRQELVVDVAGALVPSVALRAALAMSFPNGRPPTLAPGSIAWDSKRVSTTGGMATLLRYYPASTSSAAFRIIAAGDLLRGDAQAKAVAGKIVVLGHAAATDTDPGYATPLGARTSPALLVATGLSNLLQQDYLVRPAWLPWLEIALLAAIGLGVLLLGSRLPPALAALAGIGLATALLAIESVLVLASGVWAEFATAAAFAAFGMVAMRFLQPRAVQAGAADPGPQPLAVAAGAPAAVPAARAGGEDDLDMAFSMLRHQAPSDHVKQRLYDVALEHARRRDLAKAERVLRHLAQVDPDYRNAGEKLKKLAGLRDAVQAAPAGPVPRPDPPTIHAAREPENLSGRTIGRYEIEQPIGRGAMATVYLGRDPKINRRVAIKTIALAEEFTDSDLANARTQFLREAESAGRLNHPNIISIYDAGEDGNVAYLAMEFFPGKSLSHYAQQGNLLPPRLALELMARAAEALHYAHGQHVVHRDVKPANLMYDRSTDTLKITDFGIARLTDTSRTKTGIILGTPSYMSPEQLAGTNVSGQSDLFSLGVTLYQLLTGMPPFRADSIPRLMQKIAHERHEPARSIRDDLPACVDELLDRALAKDPADRYPSGRAMALALRDCCSSVGASSAA